MKNKYYFFKRIYKDYVIIFIDNKNKLKSMNWDKYLIKYIKYHNINYIVVDNKFNVKIYKYKNNLYSKYLIKVFLEYVIKLLN